MINIPEKSSIIRAWIFIVSLLVMILVPFSQGVIVPSVTEGITEGITDGVTEGRVPSSIEKGSWWENWSGDLNNNKIDDNLEWQIGE